MDTVRAGTVWFINILRTDLIRSSIVYKKCTCTCVNRYTYTYSFTDTCVHVHVHKKPKTHPCTYTCTQGYDACHTYGATAWAHRCWGSKGHRFASLQTESRLWEIAASYSAWDVLVADAPTQDRSPLRRCHPSWSPSKLATQQPRELSLSCHVIPNYLFNYLPIINSISVSVSIVQIDAYSFFNSKHSSIVHPESLVSENPREELCEIGTPTEEHDSR